MPTDPATVPITRNAAPLFPNSVSSNTSDFIRLTDSQTFACFRFIGIGARDLPDRNKNRAVVEKVQIFETLFTDGTSVEVWVHPDVDDAEARVAQVGPRLGHLHSGMRGPLENVIVLDGYHTAFAGNRSFALFVDNMDHRLENDDLEETILHESVHATLTFPYAMSPEWRAAQVADGAVVTEYAKTPAEDFPESALFALTVLRHPGRLPARVEAQVMDLIPNRAAYFADLLDEFPWTQSVGPPPDCPA